MSAGTEEGSWQAWPVWGGRWKWTAHVPGLTPRAGVAPSGKDARARAILALSLLRRSKRARR